MGNWFKGISDSDGQFQLLYELPLQTHFRSFALFNFAALELPFERQMHLFTPLNGKNAIFLLDNGTGYMNMLFDFRIWTAFHFHQLSLSTFFHPVNDTSEKLSHKAYRACGESRFLESLKHKGHP